MIESARACFWKATRTTTALLLPTDVVVVNTENKSNGKVVNYKRVSKNYAIYDIGPRTQRLYAKHIKNAGTIIWNGPMGVYEKKEFTQGTNFLQELLEYRKELSIWLSITERAKMHMLCLYLYISRSNLSILDFSKYNRVL